MINVNFMKPFYTKVSGDKLRIVFAYQYLSIEKDDEVYHFIPIEGKEIFVNLKDGKVQNLSEVFVFQRGTRFIRLPLYQLLLVSNFNDFLTPIIDGNLKSYSKSNGESADGNGDDVFDDDIQELISHLEKMNYERAIDIALENKDEKAFIELIEMNKVS